MKDRQKGTLVLVGTPIGNLGDCSERMRDALARADLIVAEDTRRLRKLLAHFGISHKRFVSYHPGNFIRRNEEILEAIRKGQAVAFTTDAGMPLVSDPGAELVSKVIEEGFEIDCVPGPSAVVQAIVLSGFSASRFRFEGFVPKSASKRKKLLEKIAVEDVPVVVFEAPHRVLKTLCDAREVLGGTRNVAVCREMTKLHQEVVRSTLDKAITHFTENKPRGEFVVVFGPLERRSANESSDTGPKVQNSLSNLG